MSRALAGAMMGMRMGAGIARPARRLDVQGGRDAA